MTADVELAPKLDKTEAHIREAWERADFRRAAALLVEAYGAGIRGFLVGWLGSRTQADESYSLFQVDLVVAFPGFRWEASARAYAYALAHNAACRYLRSEQRIRRRHPALPEDVLSRVAAPSHARTAEHLKTAVKDRVRALRQRLSLRDQALLILHVDRRLTFKEIALGSFDGLQASAQALTTKGRALRKQYERIKKRLTRLAREEGLLESPA